MSTFSVYSFVEANQSSCFLCKEKKKVFENDLDKWHHILISHLKIDTCLICPSNTDIKKRSHCKEHFSVPHHQERAKKYSPNDPQVAFVFEQM
jgi:hypothetical protein